MNLFAPVLLLVLAIVGGRWLAARRAERNRPGGTPERSIPVTDYAEIDLAVRGERCSCGGRCSVRGEGPARNHPRVRAVYLECRECGRVRTTYFDLSDLRH